MIVTGIINLVVTVVNFFQGLLPSFTIPSWLTSDQFGSTLANQVGGMLAAISGWFPVDAVLNVLKALFIALPLMGGYVVFEWVWRHVPTIMGWGTGNG